MTLDHVAAAYRVPKNELIAHLGLPPETNGNESLKAIADQHGVGRFDFVRQVQRALGQSTPAPESGQSSGGLSDRILSALLIYGYPALALTLARGDRLAVADRSRSGARRLARRAWQLAMGMGRTDRRS